MSGPSQSLDRLSDFCYLSFSNVNNASASEAKAIGRHREFDEAEVLNRALTLFWQKGYDGTSFSDLVEKTRVARPGLYAAFGNKETFFLRALDLYESQYGGYFTEALEKRTSREVVEGILKGSVLVITQGAGRLGCMALNSALACSDESEPIRAEIVRRRVVAESDLKRRLDRAKQDGDLPQTADPASLAALVMAECTARLSRQKPGLRSACLKGPSAISSACGQPKLAVLLVKRHR